MGVAKIKDLVIAALVLINVFFVAIIVYDYISDLGRDIQALENACAVLSAAGVEISPDDVSGGGSLRTMRVERDQSAEEAIAAVILGGAVSKTDLGGNIYMYESAENGSAVFRSGGGFEIELTGGAFDGKNGAISTVNKLLKSVGLETKALSAGGNPESETVTAVCAYKKKSVFNCTIRFVFENGVLRLVSGRYAQVVKDMEDAERISPPSSALLFFLSAVKKGEISCERIERVEAGYLMRESGAFGDGVIAPAWLITADTGGYIVDSSAGEIQQIAVFE